MSISKRSRRNFLKNFCKGFAAIPFVPGFLSGKSAIATDSWQAKADQKIIELRTTPCDIHIRDNMGNPIAGAKINFKMQRHSFPFGCAAKVSLINEPGSSHYRDKFLELFNAATFENALKTRAWHKEYEQLAINSEGALKALQWVRKNDLAFRGHVLVWPSWRHSANIFKETYNNKGKEALRQLILKHIDDITSATKDHVHEWDVVNELFDNNDFIKILGKDSVIEWFERARKNLPNAKLYLNDYGILTAATREDKHFTNFIEWVKYLKEYAPLDGLGLQGHFKKIQPIDRIKARLDEIAQLGLPIRITEFDIQDDRDEQRQAEFTRDFMTLAFSHRSVIGFQMWGFWEGAIWKPKAALYRKDWTEKSNGIVYRDLVLNKWWTKQTGLTDSNGIFTARGFLGDYEVTISHKNKIIIKNLVLDKNTQSLTIRLK
jgi:GH35 family endo-1,4-beta-xylanase